MAYKYYNGYYKPKNPKKYNGKDLNNIVYRSGLELKLFMYLDAHPDVIYWGSEELTVDYISPKDNRKHRYFPDVIVKLKDRNGKIITMMIEIKPSDQVNEPKAIERGKQPTKRQINEIITYGVNQAKWAAAKVFCAQQGWVFEIMTEKDIKGLK